MPRTPRKDGGKVKRHVLALSSDVSSYEEETCAVTTYGRKNFHTICVQLGKAEKSKRVKHLRTVEAAMTLRHLIALSIATDREVAVFYDKVGRPHVKYGPYYKKIVLFAASERLATLKDKKGQGSAGASVSYPPGDAARYQFIAHVHPTSSELSYQVQADIKAAGEQVEIAVTTNGLIIYYNIDGLLNKTEVVNGEKIILPELKDESKDSLRLTLDTPMNEKILEKLNQLKTEPKVLALETSGDLSLFDDELDLGSESESDDEPHTSFQLFKPSAKAENGLMTEQKFKFT